MASDENWLGGPETTASSGPRELEGRVRSGTFEGVVWQVLIDPERPRMVIGGREVPVRADGFGNFVTHAAFGRWTDVAHLAELIVRFHPTYSPLARRPAEPMV